MSPMHKAKSVAQSSFQVIEQLQRLYYCLPPFRQAGLHSVLPQGQDRQIFRQGINISDRLKALNKRRLLLHTLWHINNRCFYVNRKSNKVCYIPVRPIWIKSSVKKSRTFYRAIVKIREVSIKSILPSYGIIVVVCRQLTKPSVHILPQAYAKVLIYCCHVSQDLQPHRLEYSRSYYLQH